MQRLSGLDATFLYMETPHMHMHVASTCVFDPTNVPGGYSFDRVRAMVENRLPLVPPFRRRLVEVLGAELGRELGELALVPRGRHGDVAQVVVEVEVRVLDPQRMVQGEGYLHQTAPERWDQR